MKRQRASLPGLENETIEKRLGNDAAMSSALGEILGTSSQTGDKQSSESNDQFGGPLLKPKVEDEDEEL